MFLIRFKVNDFQSYRTPQELRLDRNMTVLAGRNNVGKSALLRAMRLPVEGSPGVVANTRLDFHWEAELGELAATLPEFGTILSQVAGGQPKPRYELWATLAQESPNGPVHQVNGTPSPWIGGFMILECGIVDTPLHMELLRVPSGTSPNPIHAFWWSGIQAQRNELWTPFTLAWGALINTLLSNSFYIHPRRRSQYNMQFAQTNAIAPDGSDLTNVVATVFNNTNDHPTTFADLQAFMYSAFPEISHIHPQMTGSPAQATLYVDYGEPPNRLSVSLDQCGTGIEQMLMLATAILTATTPRLFLIDEPHAFLHPGAERSLLRFMRDHSEHQYVVATHSAVFLNAVPLDHTCLVTIDGMGSHLNNVSHASEVLSEIGVTAADLSSADALLWIEGPSDVNAVEAVLADMAEVRDLSIRVLAMPHWIRAISASEKNAQAAMDFFEAVQKAVMPYKVPTLFVFDADEKTEDLKQKVSAATKGRGRFLPVRELENLFLVPSAIQQVLAKLCAQVDRPAPTVDEIAEDMRQFIADTTDRQLYKLVPASPDSSRIVGSALLDKLWKKWANAEYIKVVYGPELVNAVNEQKPVALEPLRELVRDLVKAVAAERAPK